MEDKYIAIIQKKIIMKIIIWWWILQNFDANLSYLSRSKLVYVSEIHTASYFKQIVILTWDSFTSITRESKDFMFFVKWFLDVKYGCCDKTYVAVRGVFVNDLFFLLTKLKFH